MQYRAARLGIVARVLGQNFGDAQQRVGKGLHSPFRLAHNPLARLLHQVLRRRHLQPTAFKAAAFWEYMVEGGVASS